MAKKQKKPKPVDVKAQIAARVAPAPRPVNVVKKTYLPGSPGATRKKLGVTLTEVKKNVNARSVEYTRDATGKDAAVEYRDTHACTLRRRNYTKRGLLGDTKFMRRAELKELAVARKSKPKKSWHMNGDRLTKGARLADSKLKAKKRA